MMKQAGWAYVVFCVLTAVSLETFAAEPSPSGRVEIAGLGISFDAPAGWFNVPIDLAENLKRSGLSAEERRRLLMSSKRGVVLSSFQKYDPKKTAGPIPTVNVLALPFNAKQSKQLLTSVRRSMDEGSKSLPSFAYLLEPRWVKAAGIDSVEVVVQYNIPLPGGTAALIRARTLVIPAGAQLFQVSFTEPASENNDLAYQAFERSIVVAR